MAPLPYWRQRLAPGIDPADVSDNELADSLARFIGSLRLSKAETLREVADVLDVELRAEPPGATTEGWRLGLSRAVTVIRTRADEIDPLDDRARVARLLRSTADVLTDQLADPDQPHSWQVGMSVAVNVLHLRADELDPEP